MFHGVSCSCDTISELQDAFERTASDVVIGLKKSDPIWVGGAGDDLNLAIERIEKAGRTKQPKSAKSAPRHVNKPTTEIKDLPYIKGGVTWAVAHLWAKRLKRTDINQLRCDLYARKQLGK